MATVKISTSLAQYLNIDSSIVAEGQTVKEVLVTVCKFHENLAPYLLNNNELNAYVGYFLNEAQDLRQLAGINTPVTSIDTLTIILATAGG
jgi:hypothetical protein